MEQRVDYDWKKQVEEFEASRTGVKGLIDSGIKNIPNFFIQTTDPAPKSVSDQEPDPDRTIPIIDLKNVGAGAGSGDREKTVDEIRRAAEKWGFFRLINHGIPKNVIDNILESTRRLHEQPTEFKTEHYSSDPRNNCRFFTINGDFKKNHVANWRDSFAINFMDGKIDDPSILPSICRNEVIEYLNHMIKLKDLLCELLSESLGLNIDYLANLECMESEHLSCLYYPPCPEPDLTLGLFKHSDTTFLTIVCQDDCGGLQILNEGRWIDVKPSPMELVVNIGDLMQLISNDKFKSVLHRVLARSNETRVSTACFFFPSSSHMLRPYGAIKELVSEHNPPLYRQVSNMEYAAAYQNQVRERVQILPQFRL